MSQHFIVHNPNGLDIEFDGSLVLETACDTAGHVRVFRTRSEKYVLEQRGRERRGRTPVDRVLVFDSLEAMAPALSTTPDGARIMNELGIRQTERID